MTTKEYERVNVTIEEINAIPMVQALIKSGYCVGIIPTTSDLDEEHKLVDVCAIDNYEDDVVFGPYEHVAKEFEARCCECKKEEKDHEESQLHYYDAMHTCLVDYITYKEWEDYWTNINIKGHIGSDKRFSIFIEVEIIKTVAWAQWFNIMESLKGDFIGGELHKEFKHPFISTECLDKFKQKFPFLYKEDGNMIGIHDIYEAVIKEYGPGVINEEDVNHIIDIRDAVGIPKYWSREYLKEKGYLKKDG